MHACVCLYEGVARRCRCSEWGGTCAEDPIRGEDGWKCHSKAAEVNTERGERAPQSAFSLQGACHALKLCCARFGTVTELTIMAAQDRPEPLMLDSPHCFWTAGQKQTWHFFFIYFFCKRGKPFPGVFRTCLSNAFTKFNFHGANHLELILACFEGAALSLSLSALH